MKKMTLLLVFLSYLGIQVLFAQSKTISGTVVSADDGMALPGVSIVVKGTTNGVSTDINGKYTISVTPTDVLLFTFVGMEVQEILVGDKTKINVKLKTDSKKIDEVIVTAYGTTKKTSFTGSAGVVSSKDLAKREVSTVTQALEGATSGVQVTAASGQPGSAPAIRIRGFGSLSGSSAPKYVVDGVIYEGDIANLNMDDVESMTVLKDAASAAIYGAQAANGIIMITTKKGKKNKKLKFDLKMSTGVVTQAIPYYETVGAKDYYELMFEGYKNSLLNSSGNYTDATARAKAANDIVSKLGYNPFNVKDDQIIGTDGKVNPNAKVVQKNLNWYEPLEQTGKRNNVNFSAVNAGENYDFFASTGYLDETGYVVGSYFKRFSSRLNVNYSPKKWMKLGTNISFTRTESSLASSTTGNSSYANPFNFARYMGPIYPVYVQEPITGKIILDEQGNKIYDLGEGYPEYGVPKRASGANVGRHIIAELDYNMNQTKTNNFSNRSYVRFEPIKGLSLTLNGAIDIQNYMDQDFENNIVGDGAPKGRYSETRFIREVQNYNQLLNYTTDIAEDHTIKVLLGHEFFKRNYNVFSGMKSGIITKGLYVFDQFVTPNSMSGYFTDKTTEGYFARLNYDFRDTYYFETSFRRDASSVFHQDARWGNFYSFGATWRMDQEEFIKQIELISQLKLRASYGQVGNDDLGTFYAYQTLYSTNPNGGKPGLKVSKLGNDDLKWESLDSYNIGLDFALFSDKLTGSIEYFNKENVDLLYDLPIPLSLGMLDYPNNIADVVNKGIEITLGATPIKTEEFTWNVNIFATRITNEITSIPSPAVEGTKRWAKGHSIYDYYLYEYMGVDAKTGEPLYGVWETKENGETVKKYDADGNRETSTSPKTAGKGYTGDSAIPDLFGSISNSLTYKNFNLDFVFTYSIGGKTYDGNYASLMHGGTFGRALHVDQLDGWRKDGDKTDIPRMEQGNSAINYGESSRWLTDASYLSLKNITLSYNLSKELCSKIGISGIKAYATGENLFMLTKRKGMNPQQAFSGVTSNVYLPARTVTVGLNVTF